MNEPIKAEDLDIVGALFGIKINRDAPAGSSGTWITIYVEDDENFFPKQTFDAAWLPDLKRVVQNTMSNIGML